MKTKNYRIILAGEGGQGVQSVAILFARAAFMAGLNLSYIPNYGVEQRGGISLGFLQLGKEPIGFPKFDFADILVVFCERAIERTERYIGKDTLYIYDSDLIKSTSLAHVTTQKLAIPATSLATRKLEPKVFNMILAGTILSEIDYLKKDDLARALEVVFADKYKKKAQLRNLNKRALELGEQAATGVFA